jgi:hypothetical protein
MNTLLIAKANEVAGRLEDIKKELKYFQMFHKGEAKTVALEALYATTLQEYNEARKETWTKPRKDSSHE